MFRKFFDKQIEKEIKKLEEHPELNTNQSQKTADMIRYCIVLFLVAVLICCGGMMHNIQKSIFSLVSINPFFVILTQA